MGLPQPAVTPRPDILAEVNKVAPISDTYIADSILPPFYVKLLGGKIAVNTATTNISAQTGRSAGGAITGHAQTVTLTSFTAAERLARITMDRNQGAQLYGEMGEEIQLGITGLIALKNSIEAEVKTLVEAASPSDITSGILTGLRNAIAVLKSFGRVGLAGPTQAMQTIRLDSDVQEAMKATGAPMVALEDVRLIAPTMLAAVLGCDFVFEATGTAAANWSDNLVTPFIIPNAALPPAAVPQVGRRIVYTFDDGVGNDSESIAVEQLFDPSVRNDVLDFVTYDNALVFNSNYLGTSLKVASS